MFEVRDLRGCLLCEIADPQRHYGPIPFHALLKQTNETRRKGRDAPQEA